VDPTRPNAAQQVRHAVEGFGLKGIKGFPAMECFHANEERIYPVYEEAQRLGIPVLFDFGLLQSAIGAALKLPSRADARFSNPMDLQRPLEAVGPERIIFGTDSSHFPRGFRRDILEA
jgi:predicted TIM-barrel fold metal-dependent hydrolase